MIKTSVIFCGGYGTRLGSITKKKPKPMVLVNKKPFLEHLIIQLKNLGIIRELDDKVESWSYNSLNEVNRIVPIVKAKMKANGII